MTTKIATKPRPGDFYRDMAERFEHYAETQHANHPGGRSACLAQAAEYRRIGANVDLAMSGEVR